MNSRIRRWTAVDTGRSSIRRRSNSASTFFRSRSASANPRSFSRPATNLARTRSCASRHTASAPPVSPHSKGTSRLSQPAGEDRRRQPDPLSVVAERLMELRGFSDCPLDSICLVIIVVEEGNVGFHRDCGLGRKFVFIECGQYRLTANYRNSSIVGNPGCGTNDVSEVVAPHVFDDRSWAFQASRTVTLSSSESTPPNGVFCLSSLPYGDRLVMAVRRLSTGPFMRRCHSSSHETACPRAFPRILSRLSSAIWRVSSGLATTFPAIP